LGAPLLPAKAVHMQHSWVILVQHTKEEFAVVKNEDRKPSAEY
jgi:hypothetical protein